MFAGVGQTSLKYQSGALLVLVMYKEKELVGVVTGGRWCAVVGQCMCIRSKRSYQSVARSYPQSLERLSHLVLILYSYMAE
jgi:hypothetical protein